MWGLLALAVLMKGRKLSHRNLLFTLPALIAATPLLAVDYTWTGGTNNTWSTALNWGGTAPANSATTAVFFGNPASGRVAPNLTASATVGGITFNSGASAFTISRSNSNTLTLATGGSVTNNSTNLQTFTTPVVLGGSSTWNAASGALAVSGVISGAGSSLTKTGTGILTLSAANTYSGGTTISAGTLQIGNGGRLGTGGVTNNSVLTYNSTGSVSEANLIGGTGSLNQIGTGTLSLTGSNSYSGGTTISAGVLQFSSLANFGSGAVALNGGALRWATGNTADISGILALGSSGGIFDTNGNNVTLASALAGTGTLTKAGSGVLFLSGSYSYGGGLAVTAGTVDFAAGTLGSSTSLTLNGGELRWGTGNTDSLTGKTITIGTGTGVLNTNGNNVALGAALAGSGSILKTGSGTLTLDTAGSSSAATTTVADGALRLGTSAALPTGKALVVNGTTANGSATFDLNGNDFTVSTLTLGATTARANVVNTVATGSGLLTVGGNITYTRATARANDPGTAYITGNLDLGSGARTVSVADSSLTNSDLMISANISGASSTGLVKTGAGVLVLTGTNTYSGSTTISAGALRVSSSDNLPATGSLKLNGGVLELAGDVALTYGAGAGQVQWTSTGGFSAYGGDRTVNYNGGAAVTWGTNFAMTGQALQLSSVNSDSKVIFANALDLGGAIRTINTNDGGSAIDAELSGVVSNGGLTISGAGTVLLSGASTYTGVTTVDGGNLEATSTLGSSSASNLVIVNGTLRSSGTGGSTNRLFQVGNSTTQDVAVTLDSSGSGAIEFSNGGSILYGTANLRRQFNFTGNNTGDNVFRPNIGNNGTAAVRVNKDGTGQWTLSGSNSYTDVTYIYEGILSAASDWALGNTSGVTVLSGASLNLNNASTGSKLFSFSGSGANDAGALTVTGISTISGTIRFDSSDNLVIGGAGTLNLNAYMREIFGGTVLTKVGSGTLVVNNPGTPDGIEYVINAGAVVLNSSNITSISGTLATVNNGGTLRIAGSNGNQINEYAGVLVNGGGLFDLNGRNEAIAMLAGAGTVANTALGTASRLTVGNVDWNPDSIFSGQLLDGSGTLAIVKTGTGTFNVSGSNNYSGGTTLNSGVIVAGHDAAFGSGTFVFNGGTLRGNGARTIGNALRLNAESAIAGTSNLTFTNVLTNALSNSNARTLTVSNTGTTTFGDVILSNNDTGRTLRINTSGGPVVINGSIADGGLGSGVFDKAGAGVLFLTGSSSYTGNTTIYEGLLSISHASALGSTTGYTDVYGGATLHLNNVTNVAEKVYFDGAGVDGRGAISSSGTSSVTGAVTLKSDGVVGVDGLLTLQGAVTGDAVLEKIGAGTLVLSGTNQYTGGTIVAEGRLLIMGDNSESGATIVENGALLGGTGIASDVTVRDGGAFGPGMSPGLFTVDGVLTLEEGAMLVMEFSGTGAGMFDQIAVEDSFTAGGLLSLQLIDGYIPTEGDSFLLFTNGGYDAGSFSGIQTNLGGGLFWDTSALASSGVVTVVPEPATTFLLAAGLGSLALRARRRR